MTQKYVAVFVTVFVLGFGVVNLVTATQVIYKSGARWFHVDSFSTLLKMCLKSVQFLNRFDSFVTSRARFARKLNQFVMFFASK